MATKKLAGYKTAHATMKTMTIRDAIAALEAEINSERPRVDLVTRLAGRLNRLRGEKLMRDVLASLNKRGTKSVDALLDSNR